MIGHFCQMLAKILLRRSVLQRTLHALPEQLRSAVKILGVDLEQNLYRVPCPRRDIGRRNTTVEPGRHGGVAQVVWSRRERGAQDLWNEDL
jgi:hypothetical protein